MDLTPQQRRAATLAALLGNALEWFDFAVYGYVATPLGHAFSPDEDPALQALAAFGVFAVGYLMRPVGTLVLGPIGDLLGRRNMLSLSIVLMGAASLLIALLPTHAQWGAGAGLALLGLRMVQGFSVGGEFTGSMTYATEAAPPGQQGLLARGGRRWPSGVQPGIPHRGLAGPLPRQCRHGCLGLAAPLRPGWAGGFPGPVDAAAHARNLGAPSQRSATCWCCWLAAGDGGAAGRGSSAGSAGAAHRRVGFLRQGRLLCAIGLPGRLQRSPARLKLGRGHYHLYRD